MLLRVRVLYADENGNVQESKKEGEDEGGV